MHSNYSVESCTRVLPLDSLLLILIPERQNIIVFKRLNPFTISYNMAPNCQTVAGPALYMPVLYISGGAYAGVPAKDKADMKNEEQGQIL